MLRKTRWLNQMKVLAGAMVFLGLLSPYFVHAADAPPTVRFTVTEFAVEGENPLDPAATQSVLAPFKGEHAGIDRLLEAAKALSAALQREGYTFHRASLPPQTVDGGRITIRITASRVGEVKVTGREHHSEDNIRAAVPELQPGTVPDMRHLSRTLALGNQQPARHLTLTLKESKKPDTVDTELEVHDQRPWTVFTQLNNIGQADTGRTRLTLGGQHSNLWDRDHNATFTYTTSPEESDKVEQFGGHYRIPVYSLGGSFGAYYIQSDVNTGTVGGLGDDFTVSGSGRFLGASWNQLLYNIGAYRHSVTFGVEDRSFKNDQQFLGIDLQGDVRSRPFTFGYEGTYRQEKFGIGLHVSFLHNLGGGDDNDDRAYADSRLIGTPPGSHGAPESDWNAVRYGLTATYALPAAWQLRALIEGQWADGPLITGERFGIGGHASVRGFEERIVTGDRGQRASVEIWTPPLPFDVQLLTFLDAGRAVIDEPVPGEIRSETLVSVGLGGRWHWKENVGIGFDWGRAIDNAETPGISEEKLHFNVMLRY